LETVRREWGCAREVRRRDLPQVQALLGDAGTALARVFRRMVADLGRDLYVAEDPAGEIVGVVSVVYARSLAGGGTVAVLDGIRARATPAPELLAGLVAFAEERARRRGCRWLGAALGAGDADLRATLLGRGYRAGELLVTDLAGAA
jgi:hypothetical protein